jgi:hypothetical protein
MENNPSSSLTSSLINHSTYSLPIVIASISTNNNETNNNNITSEVVRKGGGEVESMESGGGIVEEEKGRVEIAYSRMEREKGKENRDDKKIGSAEGGRVEERINGTIKKKNVGEEEGENIGEEV